MGSYHGASMTCANTRACCVVSTNFSCAACKTVAGSKETFLNTQPTPSFSVHTAGVYFASAPSGSFSDKSGGLRPLRSLSVRDWAEVTSWSTALVMALRSGMRVLPVSRTLMALTRSGLSLASLVRTSMPASLPLFFCASWKPTLSAAAARERAMPGRWRYSQFPGVRDLATDFGSRNPSASMSPE